MRTGTRSRRLDDRAIVLNNSLFNPFTPGLVKWTLPSLNLDTSTHINGDESQIS